MEIPLTKGLKALIDEADYELVSKYKWRAVSSRRSKFYARTGKDIYMHRLIMQASPGSQVDHANGNCLDNRRDNLRFATTSQNQANRPYRMMPEWYGQSATRIRGVYRNGKKYSAHIKHNRKYLYLGIFSTPEEAHAAYREAACRIFGEFAYKDL